MLVLGAQVLLGFQYQAMFYPGFARLPEGARWANFAALLLDVLILALLLAPAPFHRVAENGDNSSRLKHFAAFMIAMALPLIAISLGLDVALISARHVGVAVSVSLAGGTILAGLALWVGMGILNRHQSPARRSERESSSLNEKIETLLTEARVILPGVQALLGFQFAAMLTDKFDTLPQALRLVHLGSLLLIALAAILLIAPAAYHRLAADGTAREDVDRFGARAVMASLLALAFGLSGDLYVVAQMQLESIPWSFAVAGGAILLFAGLWAAVPLAARKRTPRDSDGVLG